MNQYTIKDFKCEFPDETACLSYIFAKKYPSLAGKYYPIKGRKSYANAKGEQIYPVKGTIFEKSSTPLTLWFYAIFLFSTSKNGVSAKELQRQLGVTYKCAWRIAYQIRRLMKQGDFKLDGIVEVDETYIGGYRRKGRGGKGKTPVIGLVQRGGSVKTQKIDERQTHLVLKAVMDNVESGSQLMTDQFGVYAKTKRMGYNHDAVNHWKKEFARGAVHTNTIEGFWSQLKRSIRGTFHSVSVKYLQSYVDQFAFLYNHRSLPVFEAMMGRI